MLAAVRPMSSHAATHVSEKTQLGRAFAEALGGKRFDLVSELLAPEIDFRALTPNRVWEADRASAAVQDILSRWFDDGDEIEQVASIDVEDVGDRGRVAYRFLGRNEDGAFVVEQQAFYEQRDGRISWMRVLCSGFRPRP
jgi:hypothetical protein